MKLLVVLAAFANVAISGHVAVRMPYLNPANVAYAQYQAPTGHASLDYEYSQQAFGYGDAYDQAHHHHQQVSYADPHAPVAYSNAHLAYNAPAAVGYAQVPVKAAVAVPTVHHVPAVADVPVTKYEAQPAVIQKIVDVAKPAIKTRKYEVRRPAIQKQFYDIEERTIIRPVGSALVELDEPLSKHQKGPAIVSTADGHHSVAEHDHHHHVAVTPTAHTIAITPSPHSLVSTIAPHYHQEGHVAITPVAVHNHYDTPYLHKQQPQHVVVSTTPAPIHYSTPAPLIVSSTPVPHYAADDSVIIEAAARNVEHAEHVAHEAHLAHEEAIARAQFNAKHAHLAVEAISNGSPYEHKIVPVQHEAAVHNLNHLSHEEAHQNQQRLIKLLTAKGGVAEVGFGRAGHAEHVGDAGISRARVLSATPSPYHEPVEEKVNTRRIVVSRPVQTLQEIDVVEPVTKLERVAVNHPTVIKTAKVGVERVHTSVPVYGKSYAPAIAHAQVPVEYYHH